MFDTFCLYIQNNSTDDVNSKVFVGEIAIKLLHFGNNNDNDIETKHDDDEKNHDTSKSGHISGVLSIPSMEWDDNDCIFTEIPLERHQIVNTDGAQGTQFHWQLKRSYSVKYDMTHAQLGIKMVMDDMNVFDDKIKCTISWQRIHFATES